MMSPLQRQKKKFLRWIFWTLVKPKLRVHWDMNPKNLEVDIVITFYGDPVSKCSLTREGLKEREL